MEHVGFTRKNDERWTFHQKNMRENGGFTRKYDGKWKFNQAKLCQNLDLSI